ncbi:MAG: hypothetical protein HY735_12585 [Verrucomicrobia bacterium]|nr:hypothetical protein [Verrucomicrobiota bacterium]
MRRLFLFNTFNRDEIGKQIGKMSPRKLFDQPSDMEPLLPEDRDGKLAVLALELIRKAERLRECLHPLTRTTVSELVRSMNSYYSNLIEGHRTTPRDIEAALRQDFASDETQRALQMQHLAHVEAQAAMEQRLAQMAGAEICSADFWCRIHREFYQGLPASLRTVSDATGEAHTIDAGRMRRQEVSVGRHVAPAAAKLGEFTQRFAEFYFPKWYPAGTEATDQSPEEDSPFPQAL